MRFELSSKSFLYGFVLLMVAQAVLCDGSRRESRRLSYGIGISNLFDKLLGRNKNCPPKGFGALKKFDLDSYISASWYAIKQIPLSYQPKEDFYCVRADYIKDTRGCFLCNNKPRIKVFNQARTGSVTSKANGSPYNKENPPSGYFFGMQKTPTDPAKLTVGFFPQFALGSNYWVVAAGTYDDALNGRFLPNSTNYEWAIITGASAGLQTENGLCIPKAGVIKFLGMWMFARDGVPPLGVVSGIDSIATKLGLDNTKWLPVTQEGCVFS